MTNVQNVQCCASSTVVLQHSPSVGIHIRKAKQTPNSTVSVLFKALCTLHLKPRLPAKWSNCAQIYALCTGNKDFLTQMFELSRVCTTQSEVRSSPWNMCRAIPAAQWYHFLLTKYTWQKEIQKHPKYHIFSVISVHVCRTRPTKVHISVSQLYPKLRSIHNKECFHDTPLQLSRMCTD